MLYLVGLGLNEHGYSKEAYEVISKAEKVYIDTYTIEFPYEISALVSQFKGKKFVAAGREFVEGLKFIEEAKNRDVVLLVYGSPLVATTHTAIVKEAFDKKIKIKIIHAGSILDAVAETGLQPYKFGKTTSLPNFPADSYLTTVKENLKVKSHTLILVDIGLSFEDAIKRLSNDCNKKKITLSKVIVCERLGLKDSKIYYGKIKDISTSKVKAPFCFVIPGEMHFLEKEILESFNN
ncbi:MAG: diphthine synthase [Nanoarchaeota archaeon]